MPIYRRLPNISVSPVPQPGGTHSNAPETPGPPRRNISSQVESQRSWSMGKNMKNVVWNYLNIYKYHWFLHMFPLYTGATGRQQVWNHSTHSLVMVGLALAAPRRLRKKGRRRGTRKAMAPARCLKKVVKGEICLKDIWHHLTLKDQTFHFTWVPLISLNNVLMS